MNEPVIEVPGEAPRPSLDVATSVKSGAAAWLEPYVAAAGQLAQLNSRALRTAIEEQRALARETASDQSWLVAWQLQGSYALGGVTRNAAYLRHVSDIVFGAYADAVADAERRLNQGWMAGTELFGSADAGMISLTRADEQSLTTRANEASRIVDPQGRLVSP